MVDRDLRRLANTFVTKAVALEADFEVATDDERRAFAVISLYAIWEEFCRRLVYSSAAARPFAGGGRTITRAPGVKDIAGVDAKLRKFKNTRPKYRLVINLGSPGG